MSIPPDTNKSFLDSLSRRNFIACRRQRLRRVQRRLLEWWL